MSKCTGIIVVLKEDKSRTEQVLIGLGTRMLCLNRKKRRELKVEWSKLGIYVYKMEHCRRKG